MVTISSFVACFRDRVSDGSSCWVGGAPALGYVKVNLSNAWYGWTWANNHNRGASHFVVWPILSWEWLVWDHQPLVLHTYIAFEDKIWILNPESNPQSKIQFSQNQILNLIFSKIRIFQNQNPQLQSRFKVGPLLPITRQPHWVDRDVRDSALRPWRKSFWGNKVVLGNYT